MVAGVKVASVGTEYGALANKYLRYVHPNLERTHGVSVVIIGGEDHAGTGPIIVARRPDAEAGKSVYGIFLAVPVPNSLVPKVGPDAKAECPAALCPIGSGRGPDTEDQVDLIHTVVSVVRDAFARVSLVKLYPTVAVFHTSRFTQDGLDSQFVTVGQGDNCDKLYEGGDAAEAVRVAEEFHKKFTD